MAIRGPEMQAVLAFTIRINYDLAPGNRINWRDREFLDPWLNEEIIGK